MNKQTVTYLRVSTSEQDVESQRHAIAAYCAAHSLQIDKEYVDVISGTVAARQSLDALLAQCEAGKVERIVALRIDRISRSLKDFLALVERLDGLGVALVCIAQNIDTRSETAEGKMLRNVFALFAEFERDLISRRVREGIAVAIAGGKPWGRPSKVLLPEWRGIVEAWRNEVPRPGYGELARRMGGVSKSTAWRLANTKG